MSDPQLAVGPATRKKTRRDDSPTDRSNEGRHHSSGDRLLNVGESLMRCQWRKI
jgi:hypothetical protein